MTASQLPRSLSVSFRSQSPAAETLKVNVSPGEIAFSIGKLSPDMKRVPTRAFAFDKYPNSATKASMVDEFTEIKVSESLFPKPSPFPKKVLCGNSSEIYNRSLFHSTACLKDCSSEQFECPHIRRNSHAFQNVLLSRIPA
jgi:hypothetical protein